MSLAYASHRVVVYDVCICSGMEKKNIKKRRRNPKAKLIYVLAVNIITTSLISNGHSKFLSVVNVWQWTLMKKWQNIGIWNKFGDMALHPKTSPECFYPPPKHGRLRTWALESHHQEYEMLWGTLNRRHAIPLNYEISLGTWLYIPKHHLNVFTPAPPPTNMGGWKLELWNHIIKNLRCCEGL